MKGPRGSDPGDTRQVDRRPPLALPANRSWMRLLGLTPPSGVIVKQIELAGQAALPERWLSPWSAVMRRASAAACSRISGTAVVSYQSPRSGGPSV
jgi:hypothetical protein